MLSPWNLVSLYRFKRISLFLLFQGNSVSCSCSCILFAHIWSERQLVWFSLMLWLSGKTSPQNTYRRPPSVALNWHWVFFPFPVLLCKDFCGEPLDTCPISSGSDGGDLWAVHRQKVVELLEVQRYSLVGLASSCIQEQMSKFKLSGFCCAVSLIWGPTKLTTSHWYTFAGQMPEHQFGNKTA